MKLSLSKKLAAHIAALVWLSMIPCSGVFGQALAVRIWPDIAPVIEGDSTIMHFTEGDRFHLFVRSTKPCYVRILYSDCEGRTLQLFPNAQDTIDYVKEERTYGLPTEFEVQAPFGNEELILFASTEKFPDIEVRIRDDGAYMVSDPAAVYLKRLRAMSIFGEYAEQHVRIRTSPKPLPALPVAPIAPLAPIIASPPIVTVVPPVPGGIAGSPSSSTPRPGSGQASTSKPDNVRPVIAVKTDSAGPDIVLKTPVGNDYGVTSDSLCPVEISVFDSSGVDSVVIGGVSIRPDSICRAWNTTRTIRLHEGLNTISATAADRAGNTSARSLTLNRTLYPLGSRWAVVVGVSTYRDSTIPQLKYAHRDAMAFADFLRSPNGGAFNDDHILVLLNENATRKNVTAALTTFLSKTKREDLVMLFFSGHGSALNRDESYFLMNDTRLNNLSETAVAMKEVQNAVTKSIPAERVIVFSDACFSGSVNTFFVGRRSSAVEKNLISRYLLELGRSKPGLLSVTSSAEGELSREGWVYWEHGLFTYFLVAGLGGRITDSEGRVMKAVPADANNDGVVTLGEITDYLRNSVSEMTGGKQNPQVSKTAFDRNLPLSVLR